MPQSATYVAPPVVRQYGNGGFPIMPEPPQFNLGPYPTCKDDWQSVVDPLKKVYTTNACKETFFKYKTMWLNKYREAMNDYSGQIGNIYSTEVADHFPLREAEKSQFYKEMIRRTEAVKDGGSMMVNYEQVVAKFTEDFKIVVDSYDIASGCNGHPTPSGLAPNTACSR